MQWSIPAKTFLLGEYLALTGGPALLVNTSPSFTIRLNDTGALEDIHPDSPAARFWRTHANTKHGLTWHNPYPILGGVGASSAQFVGAYKAVHYLHNQETELSTRSLLKAYLDIHSGDDILPSGYDVVAQALQGICFIQQGKPSLPTLDWSFQDLGFFIVATGNKLATHTYLNVMQHIPTSNEMTDSVLLAKDALMAANPAAFIEAVRRFAKELERLSLVTPTTKAHLTWCQQQQEIVAAKGCGAMGADTLFILVPRVHQQKLKEKLAARGLYCIASDLQLFIKNEVMVDYAF